MRTSIQAKDGKVLATRMDADCRSTGQTVSVRVTVNADNKTLNLYAGGFFGVDLSPKQACDLAATLSTWAKTRRLEINE